MLRAAHVDSGSPDAALAARAQGGDTVALVALLARYESRIYARALRLCRNGSDAEEIVQETFLRAYRAIATFQDRDRFGAWLTRIATNEARMRLRSMRRRPTESLETVHPRWEDLGVAARGCESASADDLLESKVAVERVRRALVQLDEKDREAIVLRDIEENTAERTAEMLGISTQAVRQRAHRARLRLGRLLSEGFLPRSRALDYAGASVVA